MRLHFLHRITFCMFLATTCHADSTVSDDDFFNFIRADVKQAPVVPPPVKTPTEAEAMLEKWKNYEQTRTEKQKVDTTAGRKVLMEMLLKKSLTATPEGRGALLAESERIKRSAPEAPLLISSGGGSTGSTMLASVIGKWGIKRTPSTHSFAPTGIDVLQTGTTNNWRWVDAEAGVFLSEKPKNGDLYWLESPTNILGINNGNQRFNMEKQTASKLVAPDPAVANLNTAETTQRQALSAELATQRQRVINWLLDKAKQMSADEMAQVVTKVHTLEIQAEQLSGSVGKLKGKWMWENQEITFQPGGIIANRGGQKVGRWSWLAGDKANFAVVFNGAKATAKDVFLTKSPTDDTQTTFEAHRLNAGHISVSRKLP